MAQSTLLKLQVLALRANVCVRKSSCDISPQCLVQIAFPIPVSVE